MLLHGLLAKILSLACYHNIGCAQGFSAKKRRVGTHPKKRGISRQVQIHLKSVFTQFPYTTNEKVSERVHTPKINVGTPFPPHNIPSCTEKGGLWT